MLNFVYLRSSRLKVLHFWLDSCIANKVEKFELETACWMHLEGFQVVSSHFWALVCTGLTSRGHRSTGQSAGPMHMLGTGLTGGGDRSDRCELKLLQLPCFQVVCMHSSRGRCIVSEGACMCAGGALCGCSSFVSLVCALCLSFVLSRMCRAVALA
jgi:hypothetical protein